MKPRLHAARPRGALADDDSSDAAASDRRGLALGCLWISFTVCAAMLLCNFGAEPSEIRAASEAVDLHRKLLAAEIANLKANQDALGHTRSALAEMKKH